MKASKTIIASVLALVILVGVQVLVTILTYLLARIGLPLVGANLIHAFLYLGLTYVLIKMLTEKYLRLDMEEIGVADIQVSSKWFIISFVLPAAVFGLYLLMPGTMHTTDLAERDLWDLITEGIFIASFATGFTEELIFRGVIMTSFEKAFGKWIAFVIPSFVFAIFHVWGADLSVATSIQVIVAGTVIGIMFSLVAYEEGSIWNSTLIHTIWNMVMIGGIFVIGGNASFKAKFTYVLESKNPLITGGEYGIGASVIAIAAYIIVAVIAYKGIQKTRFHYQEQES